VAETARIGIVGTGGIAGLHTRRLLEMSEPVIAALADPDPDRMKRLKSSYPQLEACPEYSSHGEMLEEAELDAALICSPHHVHCRQILDCLDAGLHVLCEKPMVCSTEDAEKVIEREKATGKILAVAYQRHSQPEFRFIRNQLQNGNAGEVQFVSAFQGQNWLQGTRGSWRQVPEFSCGGQLNDSGSHLIDIILWVTGLQAKKVAAGIESFDAEVDINSALTVEFGNGAMANISIVGNCPIWWEDITFICSEWSFFLRQGELTYSTGARGEVLKLVSARYDGDSPDRNFVDAILGRAEALAPSECGLRTIELTEAAWKSAASGEPVYL
jgi:predicted dehydrogenase